MKKKIVFNNFQSCICSSLPLASSRHLPPKHVHFHSIYNLFIKPIFMDHKNTSNIKEEWLAKCNWQPARQIKNYFFCIYFIDECTWKLCNYRLFMLYTLHKHLLKNIFLLLWFFFWCVIFHKFIRCHYLSKKMEFKFLLYSLSLLNNSLIHVKTNFNH